jgi:hypothetical protein
MKLMTSIVALFAIILLVVQFEGHFVNANKLCSAKPACAALGLKGDCCPTAKGVTLDCCKSGATKPVPAPIKKPVVVAPPVKKPPSSPVSAPVLRRRCRNNPGCAKLNLTGQCCPTAKGVFLNCCQK